MPIKKLVMTGGGTNGFATLGVLHTLEMSKELELEAISGVSVGALIGYAVALGMKAEEVLVALKSHPPLLSTKNWKLESFFSNYGLDDASCISSFICDIGKKHMNNETPTFLELYTFSKINFFVTATNLTTKSFVTFNYESDPDMKVIDALRLSYCVPIYFTKISHNGDFYVDGSVTNDIPFHPFIHETTEKDLEETLILQIKSNNSESQGTNGIFKYIYTIIDTVVCALQKVQSPFTSVKIITNKPTLKIDYTTDYIDELYEIGKRTVINGLTN